MEGIHVATMQVEAGRSDMGRIEESVIAKVHAPVAFLGTSGLVAIPSSRRWVILRRAKQPRMWKGRRLCLL